MKMFVMIKIENSPVCMCLKNSQQFKYRGKMWKWYLFVTVHFCAINLNRRSARENYSVTTVNFSVLWKSMLSKDHAIRILYNRNLRTGCYVRFKIEVWSMTKTYSKRIKNYRKSFSSTIYQVETYSRFQVNFQSAVSKSVLSIPVIKLPKFEYCMRRNLLEKTSQVAY